jgi:hypothetical protein
MTVMFFIYSEKILEDDQILSTDTIFIHQPNILVYNHCGELSLQSPYKFGIAFFKVITTDSFQHRFIVYPASRFQLKNSLSTVMNYWL